MFRRPLLAALTVAATVAALLGASVPADAATANIGYLDQSYTGVTNPPTSDKPESKLWYIGSDWFADMWSSTGAAWHIFRLDRSTQTWIDTGVANDNRSTTLSDVLWDGSHLYIASHVTSVST
ncbi:MAG TPA: hypothetical protein VFH64_01060, partial [Amnibacterium sp.]|nr:hypothetical protein [Amnibacterium sp.]